MDFKEICKARYSVRAYKPDTIPAEKMDYIKECTRLAPSAVNKQPWKFILFTGEDVSTQFRASPFERALFSALNRVSLKN